MTTLILTPAMPLHGDVERDDATWVGLLDAAALPDAGTLVLAEGERFARARLLVRDDAGVRGYVTLPLSGETLPGDDVRAAVAALPAAAGWQMGADAPPVTIVVCTRDRAGMLRETLDSLAAVEWGALEVVIVDNAPSTAETSELVHGEYPDFRYVREDAPGLSHARNAGLRAATSPIVAFTDDDVIVDPQWIAQLVAGFGAADDVDCVTGAVPSGELRNRVQAYFDARVSWSKLIAPRLFRLSDPPPDLPMFPFCVGEFGTGANFAVRRDAMLALGAFDTALGAGTGTKGGEDLDMFLRMLYSGSAIAVNPAAIVWHRHRSDLDALSAQAVGYGRGFGAWATTVMLEPAMLGAAMRRAPRAVGRLLRKPMATVDADGPHVATASDRAVSRLELSSVLSGPTSYLRERRRQLDAGAFAGPASRGAPLERRLWAALAAVAGILGLLAALPLPTWLSLILLACFVFVGPGAVVRAWVPLPPHLTPVAVPALGLSAVILLVTASVFATWWQPALGLAAIALATCVGALVTYRTGVRA
ncbi:glycosyltransferase [Microbacterium rhizophilus]|uniref:glycosyltransferase n=1 Tax=Microbacterium rhizophilus TaxID=3138934 RepID=UPI0031F17740